MPSAKFWCVVAAFGLTAGCGGGEDSAAALGPFSTLSMSVSADVGQTQTTTVGAILATPIRTMSKGCGKLSEEDVKCTVPDIGAFGQESEFVQYNVPEVTNATVIRGSVTLVGRDVSPAGQYGTTVEP